MVLLSHNNSFIICKINITNDSNSFRRERVITRSRLKLLGSLVMFTNVQQCLSFCLMFTNVHQCFLLTIVYFSVCLTSNKQKCSSGGRINRRLNWFVTFELTVMWLCEAPGAPPHGGLKMFKIWDVMKKKSTWKMKNLVIFYGFDSALFYPLLVGENSNIMIDMCWQKMGPQFLTNSTFTHIYVKFAQMLCI